MAVNTNYNDTDIIKRVIAVIKEQHPNTDIGEYETHVTSTDGVTVQLTNGRILVTYTAIEDIDNAYEIPDYSDIMITTFQSNNPPKSTEQPRLTFWQRLLKFIGLE